jgi:hypothetical protein
MLPRWERYYTNFFSNGISLSSRTNRKEEGWDVLKEFTTGYGTELRAQYEFSFPATASGFARQTELGVVDPIWEESLEFAIVPKQHLRWAEIRQIIQKYHAAYWQDPNASLDRMVEGILLESNEIFAED